MKVDKLMAVSVRAASKKVARTGTESMTASTTVQGLPDAVPRDPNLTRILGLSVPVGATLAETEMTIESILSITAGSILEFEVPADSELTLYVGNRSIGRGQAVKTGENFGLKVTNIDTISQRIGAMAGKMED